VELVRAHDDLQVAGLHRDEVVRELARDAVGEAGGEHEGGGAEGHAAAGERVPALRPEQVPERDPEEAQRYSYGGDRLYPVLAWGDLVSVGALMIAVSVLATLGPALMAARLRPAEALRAV